MKERGACEGNAVGNCGARTGVVPIVESRCKSYLSPREEASTACESRSKVVKSSKHVLGLRGGREASRPSKQRHAETGVVPKAAGANPHVNRHIPLYALAASEFPTEGRNKICHGFAARSRCACAFRSNLARFCHGLYGSRWCVRTTLSTHFIVFPGRGFIDEANGEGTATLVAFQANGDAKGRGMAMLRRCRKVFEVSVHGRAFAASAWHPSIYL